MNLNRDGKQVSEQEYIQSSQSIKKIQNITDRLSQNTINLKSMLPQDSIIKPTKQYGSDVQLLPESKKYENQQSQQIQLKKLTGQITTIDQQNQLTKYEKELQHQKDLNNELKLDINNRQERFVKREMEYRKIIEDLQQELRSKANLDFNEKKIMENVQSYHNQIMDKIQVIQYRTSKVMVDQEKDIMRFFINKINEIRKEFEDEKIKKGKNDQDYLQKENQLISELEWIKNIAQKIDKENHDLMKQFMELKAKYYTQESDREMLLKQLIIKKKKNAVLKNQVKHYEKLLEQVNDNNSDVSSHQNTTIKFNNNLKNTATTINKMGLTKKQEDQNQTIYENKMTQEKIQRYEDTIKNLQSQLKKEIKKSKSIKDEYIKQMSMKQEIEEIIKQCIEDLKLDILKVKSEMRTTIKGKNTDAFNQRQRQQLIEKLLTNEKILSLIYDKTFYDHNSHLNYNLIDQNENQTDN